jgi:transposase
MPGPSPRYQPTFPDEFLAEARRLAVARTGASHFRQRAQMVLLLYEHPTVSNVEIAARLDLHPNCVRRWRQRWAAGQFTLEDAPGRGRKPLFSPLDRAIVASIACDVVARTGNPLSRQSTTDLAKRAAEELNKPISRTTVWRILDEDAIKPWQYEHWLFPRAPDFFVKAAVVLDLYQGYWQEERLDPFDLALSSDEKTSIQARIREDPTLEPGSHRPRRVAAKYKRGGALQYLAAWDIQQGRVLGRCEARTGIEPFGRLVQQVMEHPTYRTPFGRSDVRSRVFWVVDNGSSHRGAAAVKRMSNAYPNAILVHTPVNASWLNQVEVYFSLLQRKVLTPNDSTNLQELALRIRLYEELTNQEPRPFDWKFTKYDLFALLQRLAQREAARIALTPPSLPC